MRFSISRPTAIAALCAVASLAVPAIAGAQGYPSYATASQESVKGSITGFNGAYTVYVQDDKGYGDNVVMHDGTVINPTGIKLQEGMKVTIYGYANGHQFDAYRIDVAPSNYGYNTGGYGYGGYPYGGYGYPYGGYGYGGFYPWFGIGIGWFGGYGGCCYGYGYPYGYGYGGNTVINRYYYHGPGFYRGPHGTLSAPPGGGSLHGGGTMHAAPPSGTLHGRPPRHR